MQKRRFLFAAAATALVAGAVHAQLKPSPAIAPRASQPAAPAAPSAAADVKKDPDKEKAGQNAAHAWLLLLDRRDWGTAWDSSSAVFRQNVPLSSWMDNIPKARAPFGNLVEREPAEAIYKTTLPGRPNGDYVSVLFQSKFDKKPGVQETVTTVLEPDGRWRVTGYTYTEK
ncbi:DUF4019 domain-containing protein [Caenimonas sedimenti]|nr:DUF4019 domain-containing protein [Caenimonas sedimenti]